MSKPHDKYPTQREDYLLVTEYAEKKSRYNCLLCEKTHFIKDCPNKLVKLETASQKYKSMHEYDEDELTNPHNYGW